METYKQRFIGYIRSETQENLGSHVVMVFGGTTIYANEAPETAEDKPAERETAEDISLLLY